MIDFLIKKTIKNYKDVDDIDVRENYTVFASIIGLISNLILFSSKLIVGIITSSVSIIANAIDSMADFGSNIVTIVGSKIAKKPADKDHPFGHQRVEYITGLIVSMIIVFIGGTVFIESFQKIINYKPFYYSNNLFYITISVLAFSILVKFYQAHVYMHIYKKTKSLTTKANFVDALTDTISAFIIIIGISIIYILQVNNITINFSIDGILGIFESALIVLSGANLVKSEINCLIGRPINKEFVNKINDEIKSNKEVLGTHDIMCHMYGPNKCFMTAHVEVDSKSNFEKIHDVIDDIEQTISKKYNVNLTIHMDPVELNNPELNKLKDIVTESLKNISESLSFHDCRLIRKNRKKTLILDVEMPYGIDYSQDLIFDKLHNDINKEDKIELKVNFDRVYIE